MKPGKGGTYYPPFPVLGLASDGDQIFLSAGGGGATASKEVPNVVQAHRYDENTCAMSTIASLDTKKCVVVGLTYAKALDLWLASTGPSCRVLELSVEQNTITELCEWTSEAEGKGPCQNLAKLSNSGSLVATGGTDGVVKIFEAGQLRQEPKLLHACAKNQEVLDLDFTADDTVIASCDRSGSCRLWDSSTGQQTLCIDYKYSGAALAVRGVRFLPVQGAGAAQTILTSMAAPRGPACLGIYGMDGKLLKEVKLDAKPLTALAVCPTGSYACVNLVTGGKRVISLPGLKVVKKIEEAHELPAPCAAFIGQTAISGSGDRSINVLTFGKKGGGGGACCGVMYLCSLILAMAIIALLVLRIGIKSAQLQQGSAEL